MASELLKIKGIGPVTLEKLGKLGIFTPEELIAETPADYIDLDAESDLKAAENGDFVVAVLFIEYAAKPLRRGKLQLFRARGVARDGQKVKLTWYNANYVAKIVHVGAFVRVYGKLKKEGSVSELINPTAELAVETKGRGIKPVYRLKGLIGQNVFREAVRDALDKGYTLKSLVPESGEELPLSAAARAAHLPRSVQEGKAARERVELESVVKGIAAYRLVVGKRRRVLFYGENTAVIDEVIDSLPYKLTQSQKEALGDILSGLGGEAALNAMLVGDVGSGKTIVALLTAYYAVKCGYQAALMAPTEILAAQHFKTFSKILSPFGVRIKLLTAALPAKEKREIIEAARTGEANIVIGTHAVISEKVAFKKLSLAIIDEQHRFGVAERTALIAKSNSEDTLTLSATPIPRSLRLTVFGDVEVLNIERRYKGNVTTSVVTKADKKKMLSFIAKECSEGRQAYVVCPRIRDVEGIESSSAERLFKELGKIYAGVLRVGLLHGRMKAAEKQAVENVVAQREEALAKQLAEMRSRKRKLVDPLQFEMSIQAEDLTSYVPAFGWEMGPPTDKQLAALERLGIFPDEIGSAGKAAKLLDRLNKRHLEGLTTPKQIRFLENRGFLHVGTWQFEDARKLIDRIAGNGWRVPLGITPAQYAPGGTNA